MGTVSQASLNMKAFVIVALVAAVAGEADPYTIGQVLAGQTNGGVLTSTTYHGGVKVEGFPYTKAVLPAVTYAGWNHPPCCSLWILRSQEGESVPPLPLHYLRLHHPPAPDCCHRLHQCRRRKHQLHQGLHQLGG